MTISHSTKTLSIITKALASGALQSDLWEIDSDIVAIRPSSYDAFMASIQPEQTVYLQWLSRNYKATEVALSSDTLCVVLNKPTGSPVLTTPTFASVVRASGGSPALPAYTGFNIPIGTYVNGGVERVDPCLHLLHYGVFSGELGSDSRPTRTSIVTTKAQFFGPLPIGQKLSSQQAANPAFPGWSVNVSSQAQYDSLISGNAGLTMQEATITGVAPSSSTNAPMASASRIGWKLISGPTVLTYGEVYPGFAWIAATNEDIADVMALGAATLTDGNARVRAELQIANLRARLQTSMVIVKGSAGFNPFELCLLTKSNADALASYPDVPDVDMATARTRWVSGQWYLGVSTGVVKVEDYVAAYATWPTNVVVTALAASQFRVEHDGAMLTSQATCSLIGDLLLAGKTISYARPLPAIEATDQSAYDNVYLASRAQAGQPQTYPIVGDVGDQGGVGYALMDALLSTDLKKRATGMALVSPQFLGAAMTGSAYLV